MRRKFDFSSPLILVGVLIGAVGAAIYVGLSLDHERQAYQEACITMGGTPLIGHNGTKVCLKDSVVLAN